MDTKTLREKMLAENLTVKDGPLTQRIVNLEKAIKIGSFLLAERTKSCGLCRKKRRINKRI